MEQRKIIHIDMDCFYAAVEMRERPELAGRPIAVGGGSRRGVVTTCNYPARVFGVRSAMPGFLARQCCPELIFLPVRFDLYRAESLRIRAILNDYSVLVEPLSLDEAYVDVTHQDRFAWDLAREIRRRIRETTGLTASAGVAPNKMLAKIASDWHKPNGQFAVTPEQVETFMLKLPVSKLWGVGPKCAARLSELGVSTCADLQKIPRLELHARFGKWGDELFDLCRGRDDRAVVADRPRKSLANERTFSKLLDSDDVCRVALLSLVDELLAELRTKASDRMVRKAVVKVKFSNFTTTTRECVCVDPRPEVFTELLSAARARSVLPVRLLGVGVRFAEQFSDSETSGVFQQQGEFDFGS